jgi:hypothetical protein
MISCGCGMKTPKSLKETLMHLLVIIDSYTRPYFHISLFPYLPPLLFIPQSSFVFQRRRWIHICRLPALDSYRGDCRN